MTSKLIFDSDSHKLKTLFINVFDSKTFFAFAQHSPQFSLFCFTFHYLESMKRKIFEKSGS